MRRDERPAQVLQVSWHNLIFNHHTDSLFLKSLDTNHVQDKLDHAQRHAYMLNQNMMHLAHKISKIRDIGDELVRILLSFAEKDTFDYQLTKSLKQLTSCLSSVEDHRDYEVLLVYSDHQIWISIFINYSRLID